MKKIFMSFLVFLVSFTSISPVLTVSAVESSSVSLSSYKTTVRGIVDKYVKNLDDQNFTDDQIVNSLTKLRDSYQKLLSSARSTKKAKIQIIVNTINQVIGEVQNRDDNNDTDLYNLFNQAPVRNTSTTTTTTNYYTNTNTNTAPSCTKELKMCSNGSYVGRSGPSCSFAECPTVVVVPTPTTNNITSVNSYLINGVIRADFKAENPNSLYKEYDVYLYTPTGNISQPSALSFIQKPDKLIYSYYNNYTITTNFQSETNTDTVKNIRIAAESSTKVSKTSRTLTKDSLYQIFGPLTDTQFNERATLSQPNLGTYLYETYLLYVAKDNSEAFTLRFDQSGKKKISGTYLKGIDFSNIVTNYDLMLTKMSVNPNFYKSYSSYSFTPSTTSTPSKDFMDAGMHITLGKFQYINTRQVGFNRDNKAYSYWVNNYCSSNSGDVGAMASYFAQKTSRTTNTNVAGLNIPFAPLNQPKNLEGSYRYYLYLLSDDGSEGCLSEYVGIQTGQQ